MDRQRIYRAPVEECQVRGGLPEGVCERDGSARVAENLFSILQCAAPSRESQLLDAGRGVLRSTGCFDAGGRVTGMTDNSVTTRISGDAQVAGISRNRLLGLLRRADFLGQRKKPELLPLNAADCACSRPLTKNIDEETITINRPGRSTYPEEKSVLT